MRGDCCWGILRYNVLTWKAVIVGERKVVVVIFKLKKQGKITSPKKGLYVKA